MCQQNFIRFSCTDTNFYVRIIRELEYVTGFQRGFILNFSDKLSRISVFVVFIYVCEILTLLHCSEEHEPIKLVSRELETHLYCRSLIFSFIEIYIKNFRDTAPRIQPHL